MRNVALALGIVSVALSLPPGVVGVALSTEIVQQSQAEFDDSPRLWHDRLERRHDHHPEVESHSSGSHAGHSIAATEGGSLAEAGTVLDLESTSPPPLPSPPSPPSLAPQGGHDHVHSREPPKLVLDEVDVLRTHSPDPPSYLDLDRTNEGMSGTMIGHVVLTTLAYFLFLPLAIFLKAGGSHLATLPRVGFVVFSLLGLLLGRIYSSSTPERYEGSAHTIWGWITTLVALALNCADVARFVLRCTPSDSRIASTLGSLASRFRISSGSTAASEMAPEERVALVESPTDEFTQWPADQSSHSSPSSSRGNSSTFSDSDTIYDSAGPETLQLPRDSQSTTAVSNLVDLATRLVIILAYITVFNGTAVYTGMCRGNYLNGCLAHGIKGSVFLWYGLLTFARYCGGMSTLGWAWNKRPAGRSMFTAEFVESFVIFFYGSTNTWMERIGKTGAYSVKDVQHISIAVMFWAAGSLGMLLESRTVRSWLSAPATAASPEDDSRIAHPASAAFSFNPFPALVIGVTGIAMSAHHQTYQFQVEIHALWGYLLAGFSVFRFLTYFFLYLRPPASVLPSRPPTEALASLFLTCGGVVFVLSTEQVTFAAMRHQADDMMAFLNVTFAFVCVLFFWIAVLFGLKGWATKRHRSQTIMSTSPVKSA
ncbi:hypothetical protein JCM11491_000004 [Sporobolomyces phaffii]